MCGICGCSDVNEVTVTDVSNGVMTTLHGLPHAPHAHENGEVHTHEDGTTHAHPRAHPRDHSHSADNNAGRITLEMSVLSKNNAMAPATVAGLKGVGCSP